MTRQNRWITAAGLVAVGLLPGCTLPGQRRAEPPPHSSAALLDSGPTSRVTKSQTGDVQFAIGRSNEESDQLEQAEAAYRSALTKTPKRVEIEHRLAVVLDRQGKTAEADEHFARALKLDPKNAELLCDRGYSLHLQGKSPEAEQALRSALAVAPMHQRSHTNLGLVLATRGDNDSALAEFNRSGTDTADSRANLALALAMEGRVEAARDQYAQAQAAKPGSKVAQEGLRVASSVLKTRAVNPAGARLPTLPGEHTATLVATGNPPTSAAPPVMRVDPAVQTTSATLPR